MKLLKIRNQQFELLMSIDSILSHVYALATTIVGCPFATMTTPTSLARIPVNQARNLFNQARYPVVMTGAMVIRVPFQWNVNPAPIVKAMGVTKGPGRGETLSGVKAILCRLSLFRRQSRSWYLKSQT
jgi:hypothetical protein